MKFFSGFSLKDEAHFFQNLIFENDFTLCGFSYGAIKAFEYAVNALEEGNRVDRLQLFSPAFFQTKDTKFKRLQTMTFKRSPEAYMTQFIASCFAPYDLQNVTHTQGSLEELDELLYYIWNKDALHTLQKRGVIVEVYLGGKDIIIDVNAAKEFFLDVATVTYIKNGNHFLLT